MFSHSSQRLHIAALQLAHAGLTPACALFVTLVLLAHCGGCLRKAACHVLRHCSGSTPRTCSNFASYSQRGSSQRPMHTFLMGVTGISAQASSSLGRQEIGANEPERTHSGCFGGRSRSNADRAPSRAASSAAAAGEWPAVSAVSPQVGQCPVRRALISLVLAPESRRARAALASCYRVGCCGQAGAEAVPRCCGLTMQCTAFKHFPSNSVVRAEHTVLKLENLVLSHVRAWAAWLQWCSSIYNNRLTHTIDIDRQLIDVGMVGGKVGQRAALLWCRTEFTTTVKSRTCPM